VSLSIWIPGQPDHGHLVACPVCHDLGEETTFRLPEQLALYERHFDRCAAVHADELHARTPAGKAPALFGPESGDVELRAWIAENREAILENRRKI
jgi:hypothetical protein